jgi:hypothetical protein
MRRSRRLAPSQVVRARDAGRVSIGRPLQTFARATAGERPVRGEGPAVTGVPGKENTRASVKG